MRALSSALLTTCRKKKQKQFNVHQFHRSLVEEGGEEGATAQGFVTIRDDEVEKYRVQDFSLKKLLKIRTRHRHFSNMYRGSTVQLVSASVGIVGHVEDTGKTNFLNCRYILATNIKVKFGCWEIFSIKRCYKENLTIKILKKMYSSQSNIA